jgi:nucleotide-binding universal stress UspA family protein
MKKILCPTDFSETAYNAIAYAAKFCHTTDATMTLYNVQSMFNLSPIEIVKGKASILQTVAKQLEDLSDEVSRVFKIACDAQVEPTVDILSTMIEKKSHDFDLIIMGTGGPADLLKFFTGSNTYAAISNANIPVMLIPNNVVFSPVDQMVYAYNYLEDGKLPMTQLIPWIKKCSSKLSVLEVLEEAYSEVVNGDLKDTQKLIQLVNNEVRMNFDCIHSSNVALSIHNHVLEKKADMLVLCTHHRNMLTRIFHRSVIKSVSAMASYPVLVVHE